MLRFENLPWPTVYQQYLAGHLASLLVVIPLYLAAFTGFRLYRCAWRFAGLETLWNVVYSNTLGLVGLIVAQRLIDGGTFPRSVLIMVWGAGIVFVGSSRILLRILSIARQNRRRSSPAVRRDKRPKRAVILGGPSASAAS